MKNYFKISLLFCLLSLLFSCSADDTPAEKQRPLIDEESSKVIQELKPAFKVNVTVKNPEAEKGIE